MMIRKAPSSSVYAGTDQVRLLRYHGCMLFLMIVVASCGIVLWNTSHRIATDDVYPYQNVRHDDGVMNQKIRDNTNTIHKHGQVVLLLASHGRLMWYDVEKDEVDVLHEKHGIYYGGFYGDESETSLWYVSRPHNWKPETAIESLVELDVHTREHVKSVQIDSKFTHDVVRKGSFVYAADTERGGILELELPDMTLRRRMDLFTKKEHVNTLSPTSDGKYMWAMLHNLGPSILAKIDLDTGTVVRRIEHVGLQSHGAVQMDDSILFLDSNHGTLSRIHLETERIENIYTVDGHVFLKGLCVIDGIAFFGIAPSQNRQNRADENLNCEIAAFDLVEKRLLFRRKVPTMGLLNVISAPHLVPESTSVAVTSNPPGSYRSVLSGARELPYVTLPPDDPLSEYPPSIDSVHWDSGYPRLDNSRKNSRVGFDGGVQMILFHEDLSELKKAVLDMPSHYWEPEHQKKLNAFITGRDNQLAQFKPGTKAIHLIFSDRDAHNVFEFPWYREKFGHLVKPLLQKLLGKHYEYITRVQFALMPAQSEIKPHVDTGGYSKDGHRIHFVIASNPDVAFHVCDGDACVKLHTEEGTVFELNNRLKHYVKNDGHEDRVHMVVDVAEEARPRHPLQVGQICRYSAGQIIC